MTGSDLLVSQPRSQVVIAMDKFRGTANAPALCDAVAIAAQRHGLNVDAQPMSDGGEGFSDAFDGDEIMVEACGPLEEPTTARIKLSRSAHGVVGIIEVADVIGRDRLLNPASYQALAASSRGVGYLVVACQEEGVDSIIVGCGGSSTSDGGLGCYWYVRDHGGLKVPVMVATDITARFSGAIRYAVQKGVSPDDLHIITRRLEAIRRTYCTEQGVDVERIERTGAAGGIAGGLIALGAAPISGFDAVASAVRLKERIQRADLVITGEGSFDKGSLEGKVTVSLAEHLTRGTRLVLICGTVDTGAATRFQSRFPDSLIISLTERYGLERSLHDTLSCVEHAADVEIGRWLLEQCA
jgi:glycerate kinase